MERGKGYPNQIMNEILNHTALKNVKTWKLATSGAHGLYKKYGFNVIENPENLMERKRGVDTKIVFHDSTFVG